MEGMAIRDEDRTMDRQERRKDHGRDLHPWNSGLRESVSEYT